MSKGDNSCNEDIPNEHYYAQLREYAVNLLRWHYHLRVDVAEDIAQNVILKLFKKNREKPIESPRAWISMVIRNEVIDAARRQELHRDRNATQQELGGLEARPENDRLSLSEVLLSPADNDDGVAKYLKEAFSGLAPPHQEILLAYLMLKDNKEEQHNLGADEEESASVGTHAGAHAKMNINVQLAKQFDITPSVANYRVSKAKAALRQELETMKNFDWAMAEIISEALDEFSRKPEKKPHR